MANLFLTTSCRLLLPVLLLSTGMIKPVLAQDEQQSIRDLLVRSQKAYYHTPYLGFHVKYLYSNEGQGSRHLDSLSGSVQMDKDRCRFAIDGMETVVTHNYSIQVLNEDKTIYLSKAHKAGQMDPVSMMDSVFAHLSNVTTSLGKESGEDVVTLQFPPGQTYSRIQIKIDRQTGFFRQISYWLRTAGLVAPDQIESPGHPAPYKEQGEVDIVFSHYDHGHFGEEIFQESAFFTRTGDRFEPAGRYKNYQVFLASSNL